MKTLKSMASKRSMKTIAPGIEEFEEYFPGCNEVIDQAEKSPHWAKGTVGKDTDPDIRITDVHYLDQSSKLHGDLVKNLMSATKIYMDKYRGCQVKEVEPFRIARYEVGGHYAVHSDAVRGERVLSSVLYLNDGYEGGELYFPQFEITYKPKAGSLLLFPSNYPYEHGSLRVSQGKKYCVLGWCRA